MRILLFGATGMVGQGVLRECLVDGDVTRVLCVGRRPSGEQHPKLHELVLPDLHDALMRLPFRATYMFRPGFIEPMHGVRSKTALYQAAYVIARPVFGLLRRWAPDRVTTSVKVGRAMLAAAKRGAPAPLVEVPGINALAG